MEKVKKYFGEFNMTWPRVILLAIITAVITAVLKLIPALNGTSFQDIAVNLDCWFLFAIFIIVNCKKCTEAMLKCFVFFLISQPLIYLIQVPFAGMAWGLFGYYKYWFILTVLTIPGAAVAWQLKRKDWLSVLVLSVATGYLAFMSVTYLHSVMQNFPHHLLSCIFCFVLAVFLILVLLEKKKQRIVAFLIAAVIFLGSFMIFVMGVSFGMGDGSMSLTLDEGNWTYTLEDDSIVSVEIEGGNYIILTAKHNGSTTLRLTREDGFVDTYTVEVSGRNINMTPTSIE